jgi:hypothetical protein
MYNLIKASEGSAEAAKRLVDRKIGALDRTPRRKGSAVARRKLDRSGGVAGCIPASAPAQRSLRQQRSIPQAAANGL